MGVRVVPRWLVLALAVLALTLGLTTVVQAAAPKPTIDNVAALKPTIDNVAPLEGTPGVNVSITGTNFAGTTSVKFGSAVVLAPNFTVNGAGTSITATVPATAKTGKLVVTTPVGTGSAGTFVVPGPSITGVTGSLGADVGAPGTTATIVGTNFVGTSNVRFAGVTATPFAVNGAGTQVTLTIPSAAKTGKVVVTNPQGTGTVAFTVPGPSITTVFGSAGVDQGMPGTTATIAGTGLAGAVRVQFGNIVASPFAVNGAGTQITVSVPLKAVTGKVKVTNPQGTGDSGTFTVSAGSISATVGSLGANRGLPGTTATITGTALGGTGVSTTVFFGAVRASSPVVNPAGTQIVVTVPAKAKTAPITVRTPQGVGSAATDFVLPGPVYDTALPEGSYGDIQGAPGTTATIYGHYFGPAPVVTLGSLKIAGVVVNPAGTQINFTVPAKAKSALLTVTTPQGKVSDLSGFPIGFNVPEPQILTVAGSLGFSQGMPGTTATIDGQYFGPAPAVTLGPNRVAATVNPAGTRITFTVPDKGHTRLRVSTAQGFAEDDFVVPLPTILGVVSQTPSGGAPGSTATITGWAFGPRPIVTFGSAMAASLIVTEDGFANSQIVVTVPSGATTARFKVTTSRGAVFSSAEFVVGPVIFSFTPTSGSGTAPGTLITVTGKNLGGVTTVRIGSGPQVAPVTATPFRLTFRIPSGSTLGPVILTSPGGSATSAASLVVVP